MRPAGLQGAPAADGSRAVRSLIIVSNGHGEDVIGAALARAMLSLAPDLAVRAFPLVDDGAAYRALGIERLGPCQVMPSGGAMMHSLAYLAADLRAGFVTMTVRQAAAMARVRSDVLLVVGDVYAQALAALARSRLRAVLQPLVSAHHLQGANPPLPNRYFMERISYPERALMRRLASVVYARDEATAAWLRDHGVPRALALGNPMVDRALGVPLQPLPAGPVVALLPGTRLYAREALDRMAAALAKLPPVTGLVAWAGPAIAGLTGWTEVDPPSRPAGVVRAFVRDGARLWLLDGRVGDVLASSEVALGTAGTANEQAAAMAVPVVSFALEPHYTRAFLTNQGRLLGTALTVTDGTPAALAGAVRKLLDDPAWRTRCGAEGARRMGPPGGSERIARDLLQRARVASSPPGAPGAG